MRALRVGISPCPNDTFAFHGLLTRRIATPGLELEFVLGDIEDLNQALARGELDVAKGSFSAALAASDRLGVLPCGSALGFGNGPLLLARRAGAVPGPASRVLVPGAGTTAALLLRLFHPHVAAPQAMHFARILPALERDEADFGVCIHEARFTYRARALACIEDLGERWERETGAPLPLGGLFAARSLPGEVLRALVQAMRNSLELAWGAPEETLPTMRAYAQELADDVLRAHVELYVNEHTFDLGAAGLCALAELARRARAAHVLGAGAGELVVLGRPRIFHLALAQAWDEGGAWEPASLAREGFVHLSLGHQLAGSRERHFAHAGEIVVLEIDAERTAPEVRFERSRAGARFPHLYRALGPEDVLGTWRIRPHEPLPRLAFASEHDVPRRDPPRT